MRYLKLCLVVAVLLDTASAAEEETKHTVIEYIQELTGKVDALSQVIKALEKRIEILEAASNALGAEEKSKICEGVPETGGAASASLSRAFPRANADQLWNDANTEIQHKKFSEAGRLFISLVKNYPEHEKAPEASYWVGEINMINKKYVEARSYYALAYKKFPETNSRKAEVGLKIAECYFALSKNKEGCLFLKEIMKLQQNGGAVSTATQKLMEQYWKTHKCMGN